jgi:uncharacterized protein
MTSIPIIDGDGHILEDASGISKFLPEPYNNRKQYAMFHLFPPLDHLHGQPFETPHSSGRARKSIETGKAGVSPEEWEAFLEDVGITTTVLYPTWALAYGKITDRDWAIAVSQAYNDWLHETYVSRGPRFNGMALLPMQEPAAAVDELHRVVTELGMRGAMLPTTGLPSNLGSKGYWPVYEAADRLGACIAIHGGGHSGMGFDDMNVYAPVHALGHPFGQMIAFAGIIFNGVLDKFPNLRVGFLEGGVGWLFLCLERFDRSWDTHISYDPRGELMQLQPGEHLSDYIRRHMREGRIIIGCEGEEPELAHAISRVGNEAFMYSSDFPHEVNTEMCKHEIEEIMENEELSNADRDAILRGNAERFYRLSQK